jgi:hypothetical protein
MRIRNSSRKAAFWVAFARNAVFFGFGRLSRRDTWWRRTLGRVDNGLRFLTISTRNIVGRRPKNQNIPPNLIIFLVWNIILDQVDWMAVLRQPASGFFRKRT